jgi:predicted ATPase
VLIIKRGQFAEGVTALSAALDELRRIQFGSYYGVFLGEFAGALGHVGRAAGGLAAIDETIARCERNDERWYLAELLRIRGELGLRQSSPDPKEAERYFRKSLDCAHRQQAPAWELRAATSLARLLHAESPRCGGAQFLRSSECEIHRGV